MERGKKRGREKEEEAFGLLPSWKLFDAGLEEGEKATVVEEEKEEGYDESTRMQREIRSEEKGEREEEKEKF